MCGIKALTLELNSKTLALPYHSFGDPKEYLILRASSSLTLRSNDMKIFKTYISKSYHAY